MSGNFSKELISVHSLAFTGMKDFSRKNTGVFGAILIKKFFLHKSKLKQG